jgi:hypothetical protein
MPVFLGFVNKKVSLEYDAYKADKMPARKGGENRRAEASASRRGWARPAQRHAEGGPTHSLRLEKPFTPKRVERYTQAETPVEGHSHLMPSGQRRGVHFGG